MTVVLDQTVPSITVQVGTPPPPPPRPPLPIESLEYLWYSQTGVGTIRDDRSTSLMNLITSKKNTGVAYLKEYTKNNVWASFYPQNYTPGTVPEWVYGPDPADNNYSVGQLPGVVISPIGYKIAHETLDGFPSGVYISATKSVISTPMYCPDPSKNQNALIEYAGGGIYNPYVWNIQEENESPVIKVAALLAGLGRIPLLNPRADGVIQVTPQSRLATKPNIIQLNVTQLEGSFATKSLPELIPEGNKFIDLEANEELNAFSLVLGIQPGCEDKSNEKLPWSIKLEFGEITFLIEEGKPNATVRFTDQEPEDCPLTASISQTTRHHMGERPYEISFIPVYNGLLVGFGPPQSNTWAQQTLYFAKDKTKTAFQEVARILDLWTDTDEGKGKGKKTGSPAGNSPPPPPPVPPTVQAPVKRVPRILPIMPLGNNINPVEQEPPGAPGPTYSPNAPPVPPPPPPPVKQSPTINKGVLCLPENSTKLQMGKFLRVSYHRCGGVIQFRPLFFPACWRTTTLLKGTSQDAQAPKWEDIGAELKPGPKPKPPKPNEEVKAPPTIPIKELEQVKKYRVLPVVSYTQDFEYYAALKKLPGNDTNPVWALLTEYRKFKRISEDSKIQRQLYYRRPIESWGAFIYHLDTQDQNNKLGIKFKNQDGFLTVNDLPEPRVRSVQVNRSLDGCSGSVSWDRYDPTTGLVQRPPHNVGSLRLGVQGGVDTVGGIVFTGIGVGNTESNTTSDNMITVPIYGREYKIQDQGGIKLIETPYFDGFDIREVMQYLCFTPNSGIRMSDGTIENISNVKEGDLVLTAQGNVQAVNKVFQREYMGEMVWVKARGMMAELGATPNHKFITDRGDVQATDLRVGDKLYTKPCQLEIPQKDIDYNVAGIMGWYLSEGHVGRYLGPTSKGRIFFALNPEKKWDQQGRVFLSNALMESFPPEPHSQLPDRLLSVTEYRVPIYKPKNGMNHNVSMLRLEYTNNKAHEFFKVEGGKGARNKRLTERWMYLPKEQQRILLLNWLKGDARTTEGGACYGGSASRHLRDQMLFIAQRLGLNARPFLCIKSQMVDEAQYRDAIIPPGDNPQYIVFIPAREALSKLWDSGDINREGRLRKPLLKNKRVPTFIDQVLLDRYTEAGPKILSKELGISPKAVSLRARRLGIPTARSRGKVFTQPDSDGGLWMEVQSVERRPYNGIVHNISVEYDHTYHVEGAAVHNCDYAGVPFLNLVKGNVRLPSGMFYAPLVDLRTGTPVWDGMVEAAKMVNCLPYFDRFGNLRLVEATQTTGINWNYPATKVSSYQDTPDYSVVANAIVMQALVSSPESYQKLMRQSRSFSAGDMELPEISEPVFIIINLTTEPEFSWSKMAFYPFSGVFRSIDEFKLAAKTFAKAVSRYRSSGSIEIPGNAEIELLDTFNNDYVITSVAHNIDTQQKTFRTSLTVERLTSLNPRPVGEFTVLPVTSF